MSEGPRHKTLFGQMAVWYRELTTTERTTIPQAPAPQDAPKYATLMEKIAADLGSRQEGGKP